MEALILEVINTPWHERNKHIVDARGVDRALQDKNLHVSPFMPMNQSYRFTWRTSADQIRLHITVLQD